ncbi:MAG: ferritin-like domain-containing protein [Acidobacteriaceae bacterium]
MKLPVQIGEPPEESKLDQALHNLAAHNVSRNRDMSWLRFLVQLLRLGSSLEHELMVQYLYAAYSLGGPQVPEKYRPTVHQWQETLLTVAREEMGHLMTVQNVLTFLGQDVDFARGEYPWNVTFFAYEPLTRGSLACYVFAEMNDLDEFEEREEITNLAMQHLGLKGDPARALLPVGDLYCAVIELMGDEGKIPDYDLRGESFQSQATWDDWGRGYKPNPRPLDPQGNLINAPEKENQSHATVLVEPIATRTQAVDALMAVSIQGEGPWLGSDPKIEKSHFDRLIQMYRQLSRIEKEQHGKPCWALPVPTNPSVQEGDKSYISAKHSQDWAVLFNIRYRMLLFCLTHVFRLARETRPDEPSVRGASIPRVFSEMYNLKTISRILVQMPLTDDPKDPRRAGPPFYLPHDHALPPADIDAWCKHLDLLRLSRQLCHEILPKERIPQNKTFLLALLDLDQERIERIEGIIVGLGSTERYTS